MIMGMLHCKHKKRMLLWKAIHRENCSESIGKLIVSIKRNSISMTYEQECEDHWNITTKILIALNMDRAEAYKNPSPFIILSAYFLKI
jgi:hypothetical protein